MAVKPTEARPFPKGTRVKTKKYGYGFVVSLNEEDREALVALPKPTKVDPSATKDWWFRYDELEITGR